jgi:hypothetical protein
MYRNENESTISKYKVEKSRIGHSAKKRVDNYQHDANKTENEPMAEREDGK